MSDYFNSLFSDLPDNDGFKQIITGKTKKKEEDKFNFNAFAQPDPNMIQIEQDATDVDLPPVMSISEKENQRLLEKEQEIAKVGKAIQDRIRTGRTADVARTPFNTLMAGLETAAMPAALGIEAVKGVTGSKGGADFKQSLPSFLGNKYFPGQYEGQDLSITGAVSEDFQKNYPITSAIADFGLSIAAGSAASKGAKLSKQSKFKSEIDWAKWNPDTPKQKVLMDEYLEIEKRTKADGTWMKNPDGTFFEGKPEQFIQQQSSWFKKYYNDSLVKTEKGNPLFMYHGSNNKNITEFKLPGSKGYKKSPTTTTGDSGIYFTDKKEYADKYQNFAMIEGVPKGKTYQVYTAPKTAVKAGDTPMDGMGKGLPPTFLWNHGKISADAVLTGNYMKKVYPEHGFEISMENPNLIKSAVGNVGFFDITNPNIYKGLAGAAATGALLSDEEVRNNPETALAAGMFFTPFRFGKKKVSNKIIKDKDFEKGVIPSGFENVAEDFGNIRKQVNLDLEKIQHSDNIEDLSKSVDSINKRIAKEKTELHQKYVDFFQNDKIMQDNISLMKSKDIDYGSPKYLELEEIVKNRATEYANKIGYNPYEKTSNVSLNKQSNNPKKHFYESKPSINDLKSFKYGGMVNGPKDPPKKKVSMTKEQYNRYKKGAKLTGVKDNIPIYEAVSDLPAASILPKWQGGPNMGSRTEQRIYGRIAAKNKAQGELLKSKGYDFKSPSLIKQWERPRVVPQNQIDEQINLDKQGRYTYFLTDPFMYSNNELAKNFYNIFSPFSWVNHADKATYQFSKNNLSNAMSEALDAMPVTKSYQSIGRKIGAEFIQNEIQNNVMDSFKYGGMVNTDPIKKHKVKQRIGVRKNPDGTESTHLMMREYVPEKGWVVFPSLFQNKDSSWVDFNKKYNLKETGYNPVYQEALKRNEVYEFGDDLNSAIEFADKGSWKKKKEFSMKDFLSPENILKSTSKPQIDNLRTK